MNKIMGFILGVVGIIVVFIMLPTMLSSMTDFRTADYSETESSVVTGAGVTTANVTLNIALFDDDITNVSSISSNASETSLTAESYTTATRVLLVGGLDPSTTRTLSLTYEIDDLSGWTGLGEFADLSPFIIVVAALFGLFSIFFIKKSRG